MVGVRYRSSLLVECSRTGRERGREKRIVGLLLSSGLCRNYSVRVEWSESGIRIFVLLLSEHITYYFSSRRLWLLRYLPVFKDL